MSCKKPIGWIGIHIWKCTFQHGFLLNVLILYFKLYKNTPSNLFLPILPKLSITPQFSDIINPPKLGQFHLSNLSTRRRGPTAARASRPQALQSWKYLAEDNGCYGSFENYLSVLLLMSTPISTFSAGRLFPMARPLLKKRRSLVVCQGLGRGIPRLLSLWTFPCWNTHFHRQVFLGNDTDNLKNLQVFLLVTVCVCMYVRQPELLVLLNDSTCI